MLQYTSKKVANSIYRLTVPFKWRFVNNKMVTSKNGTVTEAFFSVPLTVGHCRSDARAS
jgi:hypothetical protein